MDDPLEIKLSAARTRLVLDHPFLGTLVLRLPLVAADPAWCKSIATDARALYYNPDYIQDLSLAQTQFVLAHEALHCALSHFARRMHRNKHRWDVACDFAINPLLVQEGLTPTADALMLEEYDGLTAEEIYPLIDENDQQEPLDQHLYDDQQSDSGPGNQDNQGQSQKQQQRQQGQEQQQGSGESGGADDEPEQNKGAKRPPPLSRQEQEGLAVQWQQRLAGAAQTAIQAGKMSGGLARLVDHMLQPQLPWRMLLAHYLTANARDDYSYMRPSRREGNAILPSLRSAELDVVVVIDTSGSIASGEMEEFLAEVNALKAQLPARITLLACDVELAPQAPWVFEAWEELTLPKELAGGGGTSFIPPFRWLECQDRPADVLLYFTDAEGDFPAHEPACPVIWLVKGKAKVPWGQRIQLN